MTRPMTEPEWRAFLAAPARTAKISTCPQDGRPHVVPVWYVPDGEDLLFFTGKHSVKGRALSLDKRIAVCVDDDQPPFAFVLLQGHVTLSEDLTELSDAIRRLATRYVGPDRAEEFVQRNAVPGEYLVRVHIDKVTALTQLTA
ncbi:PPOX class F420-dependent oxidoreductase [Streptomyces sp. NRRL B-1347]|uniref:PPOX class F420-dependent oxidoreductase n=1 Tax=Streptomyces sp. NRRL B-1347 TaxID=1476877 RepID=UPI0004CA6919|nr:PPOX class F420-dependent oxidoreductase [Streptomyces sp. NRRL B-1347]